MSQDAIFSLKGESLFDSDTHSFGGRAIRKDLSPA
jgi:hypothetical protein